jgi:hypothetical protein
MTYEEEYKDMIQSSLCYGHGYLRTDKECINCGAMVTCKQKCEGVAAKAKVDSKVKQLDDGTKVQFYTPVKGGLDKKIREMEASGVLPKDEKPKKEKKDKPPESPWKEVTMENIMKLVKSKLGAAKCKEMVEKYGEKQNILRMRAIMALKAEGIEP